MTPLGLERFGCLLRHSGESIHEKHHEAEGNGCSVYWAGIHNVRALPHCLPARFGKHALQMVITLPCVGLSHRCTAHCAEIAFFVRRFHSTLFGPH